MNRELITKIMDEVWQCQEDMDDGEYEGCRQTQQVIEVNTLRDILERLL